jgi:type III pantothenate kinase
MVLAVDIGNSQTVFGLFDQGALRADWRISTRRQITADELGVLLFSLFAGAGFDHESVDGIIISSVVPDLDGVFSMIGSRYFDAAPLFVGPGIKSGMPILYDNPREVGADRIVNAVAAIVRYGAPVIILDFGTATTFDVGGAGGEYLGGVIAPGPGVSAEALFEKAARLHHVDVRKPITVIGKSTEHSMQSGLFHGHIALVEGLVRRIREELDVEAPVVATGGLAQVFEPEMDFLEEVNPQLTLEGLWLLWERNRGK